MAVACSECGEELIGSVNRCWRCGNELVSKPDSPDASPASHDNADLSSPIPVAYLVPEAPLPETSVADSSDGDDEDCGENDGVEAPPVRATRSGSPFRSDGDHQGPSVLADVVMPSYPDNVFRENLAVASVVVAIMSLIATLATPWSLIPSAVGLGLGIMGFRSERRRTAIIGIVLSCFAIFSGTWKTIDAVQTYYELYEMEQMDQLTDY